MAISLRRKARPSCARAPADDAAGKRTRPPEAVEPVDAPEDLAVKYERLRRAVAEEPDVAGHRLLLGDICMRLGRKEEGKGVLLRAIEDIPSMRAAALEILRTFVGEVEIARLPIPAPCIPFWADAAAIIRYPLSGNGPILLSSGAVFFAVIEILARTTSVYFWVPALLGLGYLASYMMAIIAASARGERTPPDYPDFTGFCDSILAPFWIAFSATSAPAALPVACWLAFGPNAGIVPLVLAGFVFWPMALIAGAIFENAIQPVNLPLLARAIRRTAREYVPALLAIAGIIFADVVLWLAATAVLPWLLVLPIIDGSILYSLMVGMDILGRIYYNHRRAIGWFPDVARTDPRPPSPR